MKNKIGLISGLILSLVIAASAFANTGKADTRSAESSTLAAKVLKSKDVIQKQHHKHKRSKRHHQKHSKRQGKKFMKRSPSPVK